MRLAEGLSARETFSLWVQDHVRRLTADPHTVAVLLREARGLDQTERQEIQDLSEAYVVKLTQLLTRGVREGIFKAQDPRALALLFLGSLNWMHTWYRKDGRLAPEELAEIYASFLLGGLTCN